MIYEAENDIVVSLLTSSLEIVTTLKNADNSVLK